MFNSLPISYPDAAFVIGVALSAAKKINEIYRQEFSVEYKASKEPVTIADRQADLIITSQLRQRFPTDSIFSEETGFYQPKNANSRIWYIDPIDGTREFIARNGEFAVQIGLANGGKLEFGLIYQPVGENLYVAALGEGCWWHSPQNDWQRLQIPPKVDDETILVISRSNPSPLGTRVHKALNGTGVISHGGVGLKLMAIAKGLGHYYINCSNATKAWDIAGPELLFREAGGIVTQLDGSQFSYLPSAYRHKMGLVASCNAELQQQILSVISTLQA